MLHLHHCLICSSLHNNGIRCYCYEKICRRRSSYLCSYMVLLCPYGNSLMAWKYNITQRTAHIHTRLPLLPCIHSYCGFCVYPQTSVETARPLFINRRQRVSSSVLSIIRKDRADDYEKKKGASKIIEIMHINLISVKPLNAKLTNELMLLIYSALSSYTIFFTYILILKSTVESLLLLNR